MPIPPAIKTQDIDFQFEFMSLVKGQQPQTIQPEGLRKSPTATTSAWIARRGCLPKTRCVSMWHPLWCKGQLKTVQEAIQAEAADR